jgi:arabinogalactan endo-1,4-beta-galactosidase
MKYIGITVLVIIILFSSSCGNELVNTPSISDLVPTTSNFTPPTTTTIAATNTVTPKKTTTTPTPPVTITTSPTATTPISTPDGSNHLGIGGTAYDWFAQQSWQNPNAPWNKIDPVPYLSQHGFDWLRAGVTTVSTPELETMPPVPVNWKDSYWCSREYTYHVLKKGADAGMKLDLFFYLSDTASYASKQHAPAGWENYTLEQTAEALNKNTYDTTKYYLDKGLHIDLYEIGNEIEFGVCGYSLDTSLSLPGVNVLLDFDAVRSGIWEKEAVLLKAAIAGVKEADPDAEFALHVSTSEFPGLNKAFFQAMVDLGVDYDYGSLSYYPWTNYHPEIPTLADALERSINAIIKAGKEVIISEFSYPSSTMTSIPIKEIAGYPFTLEGQSNWIRDFLRTMEDTPSVKMVIYFYPENYVDQKETALFSDDKNPKPALQEFVAF